MHKGVKERLVIIHICSVGGFFIVFKLDTMETRLLVQRAMAPIVNEFLKFRCIHMRSLPF